MNEEKLQEIINKNISSQNSKNMIKLNKHSERLYRKDIDYIKMRDDIIYGLCLILGGFDIDSVALSGKQRDALFELKNSIIEAFRKGEKKISKLKPLIFDETRIIDGLKWQLIN